MSPMLKRTWWNRLALFLIINLQGVIKPFLGLKENIPTPTLMKLFLCYRDHKYVDVEELYTVPNILQKP